MAKPAYKSVFPDDVPEFAATREDVMRHFATPIGKTTFHDLVNRGKIVSMKGL